MPSVLFLAALTASFPSTHAAYSSWKQQLLEVASGIAMGEHAPVTLAQKQVAVGCSSAMLAALSKRCLTLSACLNVVIKH